MPLDKMIFGHRISDIPSEMPERTQEPIPAEVSSTGLSFLVGEFGQAVLKEYEGRAKADYCNQKALNVLSYSGEEGIVNGSNPFAAVLVNQIVQPKLHVATQADLERILKSVSLALQGIYEDSGLVLRSEGEPNSYLARNLYTQIKERNKKQKLPVMIPLAGLELVNDQNSPHGLAFNLKEKAEIIHAPELGHKNNGKKFQEVNERGLPIFGKNGNRTLSTRNSGLSRLYLDRGLDLGSRGAYLADSDDGGRVVVVDGSAFGASH